jgi:hypothetical protein
VIYQPEQDYKPENIPDFAAYIDDLVLNRYVRLATLREWSNHWPQSFKTAVWRRLNPRTKEVIKLMQG